VASVKHVSRQRPRLPGNAGHRSLTENQAKVRQPSEGPCSHASCRDGTTRISTLFDRFEEAVRWRTRVHEDPLILVAVIVQIGPDSSHSASAD